jgi:hypothetical protein
MSANKLSQKNFHLNEDDSELMKNKLFFEALLDKINYIKVDEERMQLAHSAAVMAVETGTGYYGSGRIEQVFVDIAKKNSIALSVDYQQKSSLIVMSEASSIGGHTRVVERWIEIDDDRQYSLVLTRSVNEKLPPRLIADIEKSGGKIYVLNDGDGWVARGLELRRLASKFESVVLHIHMDDPIPLIAFGTADFKRPVGFYNHADHKFWLGVSVSDLVVDLRTWGRCITNTRRGVPDSFLLTIPSDCRQVSVVSKVEARKKINISAESKLVLTVGSDFKYKPMLGIDILDTIVPLLESNPAIVVIGIGMTFDYFPEWKKVSQRFNGRLRALGCIAHDRLYDYYAASDLVLDSRPMCGATALADAVMCGCPVLTMSNPVGLIDWAMNSVAYCHNREEMVEKAHRILSDRDCSVFHVKEVTSRLMDSCSESAFKDKLRCFFDELLSKTHQVRTFLTGVNEFSELDRYHLHVGKKRKYHLKFNNFIKIYSERDFFGKRRFIELFGKQYCVNKSIRKW